MSKRIYVFDNLKAFLIVMVVMGHLADTYIEASYFKSLYVFIYAFHMPMFVFISGFFHKNKDIKRKVIVWLAIGYMLKILDFLVLLAIGKKPVFHPFSEDGAPWYLFALAAYIGITYLLRDADMRIVLTVALMLGCFSGYYEHIGDFLVLSRIIVFYPYYLLGVMVARLDRKRLLHNYHKLQSLLIVKYLAVAILITWAYLSFGELEMTYPYRRLFTGRNPFGNEFGAFGGLARLGCYAIAFIIGFSICIMISNKKKKFISVLGSKTLQIYFWHWPFLYVFTKYVPIAEICKTLNGRMLYAFLAVPIVILFSFAIFAYPTKWLVEKRHKNTLEDEIAMLFRE